MTLPAFICDFDGTYASGPYRLVHHQAGFGIDVVEVYRKGEIVHTSAGHNALKLAEAWARSHYEGKVAVYQHEHGDCA